MQFHARLKHGLKNHLNLLLQSKQQEKNCLSSYEIIIREVIVGAVLHAWSREGEGGELVFKKDEEILWYLLGDWAEKKTMRGDKCTVLE